MPPPLGDTDILRGLQRHAAKFHNHKNKPLVLRRYSKESAHPARGGLRRYTAHVAAWLAFAPPGPCAVIGSGPDLQPSALLARLLKGLRAPGPRLQMALSLITKRFGECNCAGHKALQRLKRLVPEKPQKLNVFTALVGDAAVDDQTTATDSVGSAASSSKLAERLAKRFHHDCLTFRSKEDFEKTAEAHYSPRSKLELIN